MRVGVVGAGWAGLSAAWALHRRGHCVHVFESGRTPGGRARGLWSSALNRRLDNGQHVLLGGYTETLAQMRELGLNPDQQFSRLPLSLHSADGSFSLRAPSLPAPMHLLTALLGAKGLSWPEKWRLTRQIATLRARGWRVREGLSVEHWLIQGHQTENSRRVFWNPLCLAALNTPAAAACAQLFANVLRDSLGGPRQASDILIPDVDLTALWPAHAVAALTRCDAQPQACGENSVAFGRTIRRLAIDGNRVMLDDMPYDAAVVATPPVSARRLLRTLPQNTASARYDDMLAAFAYRPIATITFKFTHPWALPHRMLLLHDHPGANAHGQWLFSRGDLAHVVVSDARAMADEAQQSMVAGVLRQLHEQAGGRWPLPDVSGYHVIVEKRATFAAVSGLKRPTNATAWPNVWVAGDWTDTGYPAVLEGAVRSGRRAAALAGAAQETRRI